MKTFPPLLLETIKQSLPGLKNIRHPGSLVTDNQSRVKVPILNSPPILHYQLSPLELWKQGLQDPWEKFKKSSENPVGQNAKGIDMKVLQGNGPSHPTFSKVWSWQTHMVVKSVFQWTITRYEQTAKDHSAIRKTLNILIPIMVSRKKRKKRKGRRRRRRKTQQWSNRLKKFLKIKLYSQKYKRAFHP
jgi:hypothetical protein